MECFAKKGYYAHITMFGFVKVVGKKVEFPVFGSNQPDLFIHRKLDCPSLWHISEGKTGLNIGQPGSTQKEAKENFEKLVELHGVEKFNQKVQATIKDQGITPRYVETHEDDSQEIVNLFSGKLSASLEEGDVILHHSHGGVEMLVRGIGDNGTSVFYTTLNNEEGHYKKFDGTWFVKTGRTAPIPETNS